MTRVSIYQCFPGLFVYRRLCDRHFTDRARADEKPIFVKETSDPCDDCKKQEIEETYERTE